ncbi:MAG TPA: hypothetical protein PLL62_08570 [Candidatus Saccharicenans sp.]|nr:hypothetical protein [Candidatus Saccharicenans sp.]HQM75273.1 hypothetical protein [Candidatus Saccharicenans sp.]
MIDLKNESRENRLGKSFAELINTIMFDDECYPEPELLEGGIRLTGTTVLIRLKSLERVYLKCPQRVEAYLKSNNFTRSRDGLLSTWPHGGGRSEGYGLFNSKHLRPNRDYFVADGDCFLGYTEEEARKRFKEKFGLNALFFDFVRLYLYTPVIKLKPGVEELLDDDQWYRKFYAQFYFFPRSLKEAKVYSAK